VTAVRTPRLALVAFGLLSLATVAAFFVTQRLKDSDPIVKRIATPLYVSPNGDGRKDTARISFQLPKADRATVSIVTAGGDERRRLMDDRRVGRGLHAVVWDGRDDGGQVMPDGLYYVRVALRTQGRAVTGPRPIRLETTPPRPKLLSAVRQRDGKVRLRYSGPTSPPPLYTVYRTDDGPVRKVDSFLGPRGKNDAVWDGFVDGVRKAPPGNYAFAVTVQNKALVSGSSPPKLPPTRASAALGTGVTFTQLDLAPPQDAVRSGAVARVTVGGPSRRFRWRLTRLGSIRPLRRGEGSGHTLAFRVPADAPTGVYTLAVTGAGHRATAPIAVSAPGAAPVLVVLPTIAWQGRNAVDGDRDGFDETLENSNEVGTARPLADGRPPAGFASRVAPLMRFLGRRQYDLTTDLALARGDGPRLRDHQGVLFVGDERWLPTKLNRQLRDYVEGGGKVASFGTDSFRRRVTVTRRALSDPSRPERTNVFGERTSPATTEPAPLVRYQDSLNLFKGTDGLVGLYENLERSDGLVGGAKLATAAGRDPQRPAFVGYTLGDGVVVRVGVPGWAAALDDRGEEATVTKRIWALLSR
jgi:flagellar hook assembly protein FlgD